MPYHQWQLVEIEVEEEVVAQGGSVGEEEMLPQLQPGQRQHRQQMALMKRMRRDLDVKPAIGI